MSEAFYRLSIRFTNGETERFILCSPIDGGQITERTRFAIVRTRRRESDENEQVFVAGMADVSFVKTEKLDAKELRHRVAGIAGSMGSDESSGPDEIATIDFV